ncbi:MAG: hypothetical protein PHY16_02430 [Methylobacter sp.]|nr:hypothetical protein [Methylobacter sp.]
MDGRTHPPGADWHLPLGVRGRKAPHDQSVRNRLALTPLGCGAGKPRMNPGSMDGFELTIHGAGYPLPGEYDGPAYNLTKLN